MPTVTPAQTQRIIPYLAYADAPAAIAFLCKAFGFEEKFRYPMDDGRIGHAELTCDGNALFLASLWPEMGHMSPRDLPGVHSQLYCWVDDLEAHHERARAAGATIATPPADSGHGERTYRAVDPEGHRWIFATKNPAKGSAS